MGIPATQSHLEVAVNSPVGAPRVTRVTVPPEGSAISFFAEASERDLVVDERESNVLRVNTIFTIRLCPVEAFVSYKAEKNIRRVIKPR